MGPPWSDNCAFSTFGGPATPFVGVVPITASHLAFHASPLSSLAIFANALHVALQLGTSGTGRCWNMLTRMRGVSGVGDDAGRDEGYEGYDEEEEEG